MSYEEIPVELSEGKILAHNFTCDQFKQSKGCLIDSQLVSHMIAAGAEYVSTISIDDTDLMEGDAAHIIAENLVGSGLYLKQKINGAVDVLASVAGTVLLNEAIIHQCNLLMRTTTIATREQDAIVNQGDRVATIKVIPYTAKKDVIAEVSAVLSQTLDVIAVNEFKPLKIGLIQTQCEQQRDPLFDKTQRVMQARLAQFQSELTTVIRCDHSASAIVGALNEFKKSPLDLIVIVGPTAIIDEKDLIPESICIAGGYIEHYGMPVEPGHMLLLAHSGTVPIIGAPTCIRSNRQNGFDLLIKRFATGLPVSASHIMKMGIGGLLC